MTTVYCDCCGCYNNDDGRCELDAISMTGRMKGGAGYRYFKSSNIFISLLQ